MNGETYRTLPRRNRRRHKRTARRTYAT